MVNQFHLEALEVLQVVFLHRAQLHSLISLDNLPRQGVALIAHEE